MERKAVKTITKKQEVVVGFICDCCGKDVDGSEMPNSWHEFGAHHDDWGNDSIDSWKYFLACSPLCYAKLLVVAVDKYRPYRSSAEIDDKNFAFAESLAILLQNTVIANSH